MQSHINQEGITITPKGMAEISQRFEEKEALLAEMRVEREAQYAHRHSHVGVEIGLDIKEFESMRHVYRSLADMADWCARESFSHASRTLYSLANGVIRAAVQIHGPGAIEMMVGLSSKMPTKTPGKVPAKIAPENQSPEYREARALYEAHLGNNPDYFLTDDAPGAPAGRANAHMMVGSDEGMIYDEKGALLAQARNIGSQSPDDVAAAIRGEYELGTPTGKQELATPTSPEFEAAFGEDDEPSHTLEPAVSPEPAETVQRQRAHERRRQRQAAKQAAS